MATEFNPGGPVKPDGAARVTINPPMAASPRRTGWGALVAILAIAAVIAVGVFFTLRAQAAPDAGGVPISGTDPAAASVRGTEESRRGL